MWTTYIWAVVEKGREVPFEGPHNPTHHNMLVFWSRAHVLSFSVSISRTNRRQVCMSSQGMCISSVIPKWTAWLAVCIYNHICREHAAMTTSHFFSWAIFPTFWGHPSDLLQKRLSIRSLNDIHKDAQRHGRTQRGGRLDPCCSVLDIDCREPWCSLNSAGPTLLKPNGWAFRRHGRVILTRSNGYPKLIKFVSHF